MLNLLGPDARLDVTGKGTVRWFDLGAQTGNAASVLNLHAGVCRANRVGATVTTTPTYVNFNGGTLRAAVTITTFLQGLTAATIYSGGAIIDSANMIVTAAQALLAPTGYGVVSVKLTSRGAGYIGAPLVMITGGSGVNATAIARVDLNPNSEFYGQITSIDVTSPGVRYQPGDVLTVNILGGGYTSVASASATLGVNSTVGGLTKIGAGKLTLSGVSTYAGATTISNGALRVGIVNALPTNSVINVDGGSYELGNFTVTNGPVNTTSGSIVQGRLNSTVINKDGDGLVYFSAIQSAPSPVNIKGGTFSLGGAAGLYEGRVSGAWNVTTPNPQTAVQLCPTNAYRPVVNSDGVIWVDNSTYIYTGTIWNRSATSQTWTFCKSFDDSGMVMIDGVQVINHGAWDVIATANYVVTPGPHAFEVRLGQGSGGVGQVGTTPGIGFDRQGRSNAAFCVPIVDPGDGSLLTLSGGKLADASTVELAASGLLDIGNTAQTVAGVSGIGTVSNGALTVTQWISPAGTNAIGTLTSKANTTLRGKLFVDVAPDGSSDCLDVQADLTLTSSTLEIQNPQALRTPKVYTLVTYPDWAVVTDMLPLPESLNTTMWALRQTPTKIQLYYQGGTLILFN